MAKKPPLLNTCRLTKGNAVEVEHIKVQKRDKAFSRWLMDGPKVSNLSNTFTEIFRHRELFQKMQIAI